MEKIDAFILKQFYQIIAETINKSLSNCVERKKIESWNCESKLYFLCLVLLIGICFKIEKVIAS